MSRDWEDETRRWGIELSYVDVRGQRQEATPEALQRIIDALRASGHPPMPFSQPGRPIPSYQGNGQRAWIASAQLYSLRSQRNWGIGDFTDLAHLIKIVAELGAAGVGINPLHALFAERPEDASPYAPNSRLFLNPLYIDVEAIPYFPRSYAIEKADLLKRLHDNELIDYSAVASLKWPALRAAHRSFREHARTSERTSFERFSKERGLALLRFAAFETLRAKFRTVWWDWPVQWRKPRDDDLQRLQDKEADELEFHYFVQWIADRQLQACGALARASGMSIGLYIDVAVGVDASGADAWIAQDAMLRGLSVGAPPDVYNTIGQDWGLTSFNPHGLVLQKLTPMRDMLQAAMRYAGAIRIDHALGLMRLYVIPHGSQPTDGAYIRFPLAVMLNVIAEESRLARCIVIGEDLGTVPENFRDEMHVWGLWSYLVMLFERKPDGSFRKAERYREHALATFSTHDLPTYSGWLTGHDLVTRRAIGIDPGESDEDRERSRSALREVIGVLDDFVPVVEFLAATPTRLVAIALEDVLALRDQINVPGTLTQHPNWRRRLPVELDALREHQGLRDIAAVFRRFGRADG
jgi:4-alpha-glucanotransferase